MGSKNQQNQPWVEKYRPRSLDDVSHQTEVISVLKSALKQDSVPHFLFYGPPGTGKTSTALALTHELFGAELFGARVLELNSSDERGIQVVRDKVKTFASLAVGQAPMNYHKKVPNFKVIILDEADSMTADAQTALRRTMETYTRVTRFIIICNYSSRIIEPLASRCAKFRFKPLDSGVMSQRLNYIAEQEGVQLTKEIVQTLEQVSGGDLRRAINILQSTSYIEKQISKQSLLDASGEVPLEVVQGLINSSRAVQFREMQSHLQDAMQQGYSAQQILLQLLNILIYDDKVDDSVKAKISYQIAQADKFLMDGANDYLQLLNVFGQLRQELMAQK